MNKMVYQTQFVVGGSYTGTLGQAQNSPLRGFSLVLNNIHRPHTDVTGNVLGAAREVDGLTLFRQQYARYIVHEAVWDINVKIIESASLTSGDIRAANSPAVNHRMLLVVSPLNDGTAATVAPTTGNVSGFVNSNIPPSLGPGAAYTSDEQLMDFMNRRLQGGSRTYSEAGTTYDFNIYPIMQHKLMGRHTTGYFGTYDDVGGFIEMSSNIVGVPAPISHTFHGSFKPLQTINDYNARTSDNPGSTALYGTRTWWDHTAPTWGNPADQWYLQLDCYTYPIWTSESTAPDFKATLLPTMQITVNIDYYVEFFMPYAVQQSATSAEVDEEFKDFPNEDYWQTEAGVAEITRLRMALDPLFVSTDYKIGIPQLISMMDDDNKDDEKGVADLVTTMLLDNTLVSDETKAGTVMDLVAQTLIPDTTMIPAASDVAAFIGERLNLNCAVAAGNDFSD